MLSISNTPGCCKAFNLYNLGGAHGHPTAKDQTQFNEWLASRINNKYAVYYAFVTPYQAKSVEYLEGAGFTKTQVRAGLIMFVQDGKDLEPLLVKTRQEKFAREAKAKTATPIKTSRFSSGPDVSPNIFRGIIWLNVVQRLITNVIGQAGLGRITPEQRDQIQIAIRNRYFVTVTVPLDIRLRHNQRLLRDRIYRAVARARG